MGQAVDPFSLVDCTVLEMKDHWTTVALFAIMRGNVVTQMMLECNAKVCMYINPWFGLNVYQGRDLATDTHAWAVQLHKVIFICSSMFRG